MACGADSVRAVFLVLMCLVVSSLGPVTASHIEFVALVHRHGDRSPVSFLPTSLNNGYWKEGPGQLTAIGVSMLHKLGVSLRERYVTNTSLFPGFYSRRHVYVRSTDVDRTLMSAESLLEGLFPAGTGPDNANGEPALPNDLQPVPIHTVRPDEDPLLRGYADKECAKFHQLFKEQQQSSAWLEMEATHASFMTEARNLSGLSDLTLGTMFKFHDPLVCDRAHNLSWPAGVTQPIFEEAAALANFSLQHMFYTKEQQRLGAGVLVGAVGQRLKSAAQGAPQPRWKPIFEPSTPSQPGDFVGPRFVEYSAHDTTLAALLSALQLFNGHNPPYASSVVFELHNVTDDASAAEPFAVRMWYNQGVDSLWHPDNIVVLPGCVDMCPLSQFLELTAGVVPSDYAEECEVPGDDDDDDDDDLFSVTGAEFVAGFVGIVIFALTLIIAMAIWRALANKSRGSQHRQLTDSSDLPDSHSTSVEMPSRAHLSSSHGPASPVDSNAFTIDVDDDADDQVALRPGPQV